MRTLCSWADEVLRDLKIEKGKEATLVVVDGNPQQDVHALSAISMVLMKGERVARADLFEQK